ncbi:MAG: hypothetical protein CL589_13365 [Alteromonadaceae bacterium]|nr:hypothetical protein [Alteromonadaceae bacterium]MAX43602.1 hypothetical protein [Alteromonadaceae bacterium]|tara:strand:+ start:551 stop:1045 length:495 start_codon:yes stop_codon:yes gene_type:complete
MPMHLDLSTLIDADTQLGIDELAEDYLDAPLTLLWPRWVTMYDEGELPLFVYQAAAQQLAAYACVFSQLQFGLFCSKHYPMHGPILIDDVAHQYLKMAFRTLSNGPPEIVKWFSADKPICVYPGFEANYWRYACNTYLKHAVIREPNYSNTMAFAAQFIENKPN